MVFKKKNPPNVKQSLSHTEERMDKIIHSKYQTLLSTIS